MDDFDDVGITAMSPDEHIGQLETIPEEVPISAEEQLISKDVFTSPERKKERKSRAEVSLYTFSDSWIIYILAIFE